MKKCLLCGTIDESGKEQTCPMDGEASWMQLESPAPVEVVDEVAPEAAPKKRSRR